MLVDGLSLKLIYIELKQFNVGEGMVTDIVLSREILDSEFTGSPTRFQTYKDFETYFNKINSQVDFEKVNTRFMSIYSLKSFNVKNRKKGGLFNVAKENATKYRSTGPAAKILINSLNTKYIKIYDEVHKLFHLLRMDEYILTSDSRLAGDIDEYIEYGYIERYFGDTVDKLKKLYRKYKNK